LRSELATGWKARDGGRVWQFDLRADVIFHDETPLTAQDVMASLSLMIDGELAEISPLTIEITLREAMRDLPLVLSQPEYVIRPAHDLEGSVGTGLYRVTMFDPGKRLLTKRVSTHYKDGTAGWFDEVELTSIPSEAVRGQALGEYLVDAVDLRDADVVAAFDDIAVMPNAARPSFAVLSEVAQPTRIGSLHPLDNLRAAERWWFTQT
jgi:peptide/nickel transport system substrate-binding protein